MEVHQEVAKESKNIIFKGKRTKRQRTMFQPFLLTMAPTTSSSCSSGEAIGGVFGDHLSHYSSSGFDRITTSPSNSSELTQSSVEEEDMANCLILLAQGHAQKSAEPIHLAMTSSTMSSSVAVAAHHDVYQCKTCNRSFPSFQALGGHRASHKKPKPTLQEKNPPALSLGGHQESSVGLIKDEDTTLSFQIPSISRDLSNPSNNNKSRVHECSVCGAEFSSGQALGGHMRRHRPLPMVTSTSSNDEGSQEAVKKPKTLLSLDLNLPAAPDQPEDDYSRESKYPFASSKEQVIVFSASHHPLVDCHF